MVCAEGQLIEAAYFKMAASANKPVPQGRYSISYERLVMTSHVVCSEQSIYTSSRKRLRVALRMWTTVIDLDSRTVLRLAEMGEWRFGE